MEPLRPFWPYYGGKWRAAPLYPPPSHGTLVEPFAGAAGYSLRYPNRRVILVERDAVIAEIWRWLIGASEAEVLALPAVDRVEDLPAGCAQAARDLVGFCLGYADRRPRKTVSPGVERLRAAGQKGVLGWNDARRARTARQLASIRHWRVIEGDYRDAPDVEATWFIDPPYNNGAGRKYVHGSDALDFEDLAGWCRARRGQVMVCENDGATWLPFEAFAVFRRGAYGSRSREVLWRNDLPRQLSLFRGEA